jgi:hypothetical protein
MADGPHLRQMATTTFDFGQEAPVQFGLEPLMPLD